MPSLRSVRRQCTACAHPLSAPPPAASLPTQVCLQRNLPGGSALEAAAESAYEGVQLVNGLECKLCNLQQKVKKVGGKPEGLSSASKHWVARWGRRRGGRAGCRETA